MSDDARLSDFSRESSGSGDDPEQDENDPATPGASKKGDSATALATYAWGEYVCARCEAETERVWKDDDVFVCPDCKEW